MFNWTFKCLTLVIRSYDINQSKHKHVWDMFGLKDIIILDKSTCTAKK